MNNHLTGVSLTVNYVYSVLPARMVADESTSHPPKCMKTFSWLALVKFLVATAVEFYQYIFSTSLHLSEFSSMDGRCMGWCV